MLTDLFETFLRQAQIERGLSDQTLTSYRNSLSFFLKFGNGGALSPSRCLNRESLRNFLYHGMEERGWSARTYHIHHNNISMFCRWLVAENQIKENPLDHIQKPKVAKPVMQALSEREVHRLLYAALLKSARTPFLKTRNHAILMLGLHTGLRMSEIMALNIDHLNYDAHTLLVNRGKGARGRVVVMTSDLTDTLENYVKEHSGFYGMGSMVLFPSKNGNRLTAREFRRITDRIAGLAGVKFSSHDLRRTYATNLSKQGISPFIIQRQLGHTDIKVTMRYVCHDDMETESALGAIHLY